MATPHISANKGDFAKIVLMAGDPLRAKWIAETFLVNAEIVTQIRGMYGYTGYTKSGKRVSVMGSGMGMPSIGIYSYELFSEFDVDAIVRIGTCGSYQKNVQKKSLRLPDEKKLEAYVCMPKSGALRKRPRSCQYSQYLVTLESSSVYYYIRQVSWLRGSKLSSAAFPEDYFQWPALRPMQESSPLTVTRSHRIFTCFPILLREIPEAP